MTRKQLDFGTARRAISTEDQERIIVVCAGTVWINSTIIALGQGLASVQRIIIDFCAFYMQSTY